MQRKMCVTQNTDGGRHIFGFEKMKLTLFIVLMAILVSSPVAGVPADTAADAAPKVIILSYHKTDGRRYPQAWYDFQLEEDGRFMLTNSTNRSQREALRAEVPAYVADSLAQIVREEKMSKYKEHYTQPHKILDGTSWSLYVRMDDKTSFSSSGYMAWPKGDGLERLNTYLGNLWKLVEGQAEVIDLWER